MVKGTSQIWAGQAGDTSVTRRLRSEANCKQQLTAPPEDVARPAGRRLWERGRGALLVESTGKDARQMEQ